MKGYLSGGVTTSSCTFSYRTEQVTIQIIPASQAAETVKVDTELWGTPTHPAGLGPKGDYFFSKSGEAEVIFVKGPFLGEVVAEMGPTHAAVVADAQRLVSLGTVVYSLLKA